MSKSKKPKHFNEDGKRICGALLKSKGRAGSGKRCQKAPMPNGKCSVHGGVSTGPKNSAGYYKKQVIEAPGGTRLEDALGLTDPLDLTGEMAFIRKLLVEMEDDPLRVYCHSCKTWVKAMVECPNKDMMNEERINDGKSEQDHFVHARDNDFSKIVLATKQLSEVAKNHKEIKKGKEITVRIEILNLVVMRVIEAYEEADKIQDPNKRRTVFVERLERLLIEQPEERLAQGNSRHA